ncbi:something about silencing, SAS, complex subunit 4-domain-containing protein, partial [Lineolata rhizophorae]
MHEKVQLERLLDGLLGHDWLRVLGVTGVTDSEKKAYEPKRDYFIREVRALVDKFRVWKEEEKRMRGSGQKAGKGAPRYSKKGSKDTERDDDEEEEEAVDKQPPPSAERGDPRSSPPSHAAPPPPPPAARASRPEPAAPFTSFFKEPHRRDLAMGRTRHGSRTAYAFGHPVPDVPEKEFGLPDEWITPEALRDAARRRRRQKRE